MKRKTRPAKERFLLKIKPNKAGCWIWTGAQTPSVQKTANPRGQFSMRASRITLAHRASWLLFRGEIPAGKVVRHSCGVGLCVNPEHLFVGVVNRTHGHSTKKAGRPTKAYSIWVGIRQRCGKRTASGYKNYGAKGIRVCDKWKSFDVFLEDMGEPPSDKHTIDRKDNTKGYEPGNCRWATPVQQAANRRRKRSKAQTSTYRGVGRSSTNRFSAKISNSYLGSFETEIEAAQAYDAAAKRLYADHAHLNFPEGLR